MERAWVFDVDGTIVDSLVGTSLRPGTCDLLSHLHSSGIEVVLWSAGGDAYAEDKARRFGIDRFVTRYAMKQSRDADGRYEITPLGSDLSAFVFVDDRPEDMPVGAEVIAVSPYLSDHPYDRGLRAALERAGVPA